MSSGPSAGKPSGGDRARDRARDEAAAEATRRRLREQGIVAIEPDERVGVMLDPGEDVVAVRRAVSLDRRAGWKDPSGGIRGDLYVTTRRLLHLGRPVVAYDLADIRDAIVSEQILMLLVAQDRGLAIRVEDPRVLRVEIAAVREASRSTGPGASPAPGAGVDGPPPTEGQTPSR